MYMRRAERPGWHCVGPLLESLGFASSPRQGVVLCLFQSQMMPTVLRNPVSGVVCNVVEIGGKSHKSLPDGGLCPVAEWALIRQDS